jgi:zeta-carotene desaturase
VLAVPFDSLAKLLPDSVEGASNPSRDLREKLTHFETSPITGVHLWFDRQITDLPHAVLLDRTIQWMFHKSQLLNRDGRTGNADAATREGTASAVPLGAATPAARATASDSSYVELVISSSKSLRDKPRQEIVDLALTQLREFFPAARDAVLLKSTVIKEVNATFSPVPGIDRYRPASQTAWPRIFLAGDWIATAWPATMESAVRSGCIAAELITKNAGAGKRFLVPDLPPTGLMRILT